MCISPADVHSHPGIPQCPGVGARNSTTNGCFILATNWSLDDDDDEQDQSNNKPDPVRAQLKKLEADNKKLMTELNAAKAVSRKSTIKDVLTEKKLNPKLAGLIPTDIDATPDAIDKWLDEYSDLFPKASSKSTDDDDSDASGDVDVDDLEQEVVIAAHNRMAKATTSSTPPGKPGDILRKVLSKDLKPEELLQMIEDAGGGFGTG